MTQRVPVVGPPRVGLSFFHFSVSLFGLCLLGLVGCAPGAPVLTVDAPGLIRSPDGTGYCCPAGPPSCNCTPLGGYTTTGSCEPGGFGVCDAQPSTFEAHTDEHGCRYYTINGFASCLVRPDGG